MKERFKQLALVVIGTLVGFMCAEMIVRTWFSTHAYLNKLNDISEDERGKFCRYDELLGWHGLENAEGDLIGVDFRHHVRHNSFGFRGNLPDPRKKKGRTFLFLGDSFVWGFGVEDWQTFTAVMEQRAQQPVAIVNMGVSGFSTDQEYLLWRKEGGIWGAKEVILTVFLANDLWENLVSDRYGYYKPLFRANGSGQLTLTNVPVPVRGAGWTAEALEMHVPRNIWVDFFVKRSVLVNLALNAAARNDHLRGYLETNGILVSRRPGYEDEYQLYYLNLDKDMSLAWHMLFSVLHQFNNELEKSGARLSIVGMPSIAQVYPELWDKVNQSADPRIRSNLQYDAPNVRLSQWCLNEGIRFIDLLPALREAGKVNPHLYYPLDLHLTKDGHRVVADVLLRELHINE